MVYQETCGVSQILYSFNNGKTVSRDTTMDIATVCPQCTRGCICDRAVVTSSARHMLFICRISRAVKWVIWRVQTFAIRKVQQRNDQLCTRATCRQIFCYSVQNIRLVMYEKLFYVLILNN